MEGKRHWLGWVAIGLGALALVVALLGRGFGSQFAAGPQGANAPQSSAQQSAGPQGTGPQSAPGANAQPGAGRQGAGPQDIGPQSAGPQGGVGPQAAGPQGAEARHGAGRPGDAGFGIGGWFRFPLKLLGGVSQMAMLALLILLGVWLIRGRRIGGAPASTRAEPAQAPPQAPLSPTGESYTDEPSDPE